MITVRPATAADLDAIVASEAEAFPEDPWSHNLVAEGIGGLLPTVSYLVAEEGAEGPERGRVVGHAVLSVVGEDAELQRIAVAGAVRRRGIGALLLDACVAGAAEQGAERLLLEVREGNAAALALYARAGFTELARRPRYYRDGDAALVLARPVSS